MMGLSGIGGRSGINVANAMLIGWDWCLQVSMFLETWKVGIGRPSVVPESGLIHASKVSQAERASCRCLRTVFTVTSSWQAIAFSSSPAL